MTDKEFNRKAFLEYVKNFDNTNFEIKGKVDHSIRVAGIMDTLSHDFDLVREIGFTLGLLHDIYRFEQFTKYKTFEDYKTVDHGAMACKMLFQDGMINNFKIDKREYALYYFAILNHNKYAINEKQIYDFCDGKMIYNFDKPAKIYYNQNIYSPETIIDFAKLMRDADKIDIIHRLIIEKNRKLDSNKNGYTESVYKLFMNGKMPVSSDCETKLDRLMINLGYLYDINFNKSWKYINIKAFFKALVSIYSPQLTKEDQATFKKLIASYQQLLDRQSCHQVDK